MAELRRGVIKGESLDWDIERDGLGEACPADAGVPGVVLHSSFRLDGAAQVSASHEANVVHVEDATFIPGGQGTTLRATLIIGDQTVTMSLQVTGDDQQLTSVLDRLAPTVQKVAVRRTKTGGEIAITMLIGERAYVSRLPLDGADAELLAALHRVAGRLGHQ